MRKWSEIVEGNLDTVADAMTRAAREVENAVHPGWVCAVVIDRTGAVSIYPLQDNIIPFEVREGGALVLKRFYSGADAAPEGWADSVDWVASAALIPLALRQWELEMAELEAQGAEAF